MYTPVSLVDALFEVDVKASPSNYLINHIRFNKPPQTLNWFGIQVVRKTSGYPEDPKDGVLIKEYFSDDLVFIVSSVDSAGGITGVSLFDYGSAYDVTVTAGKKIQVTPTSCSLYGGSKTGVGSGAVLNFYYNSSFLTDIVTAGAGYKVNDFLRVPGDSTVKNVTDGGTLVLSGATKYESLSESYYYHLYDDGTVFANTVNPGYGKFGQTVDGSSKYYYSVFVYYNNANNPYWTGTSTIPPSQDLSWKKIGQASSYVVYPDLNSATGNPKTVDTVLAHLPNVYKLDENNKVNTDLVKFISLLSFHLDMYKSNIASVFNRYDLNQADELLLKDLLKEFGISLPVINDLNVAKKILKYVVSYYRTDRGTNKGIQNSVELYGGAQSNVLTSKNLLTDYNTSSFLENTGSWYPDPAVPASYGGSKFSLAPYSLNPQNGSNLALNSLSASSYTINSFNAIVRKVAYSGSLSATSANALATTYSTMLSKSYDGSGVFSVSTSLAATATVPTTGTTTTLTVTSTNGVFVKALVSGGSVTATTSVVSVGEGTVTITPKITSVIASGTTMTFTGDYAYPLYTPSVKLSSAVTSSTVIKVSDTTPLFPGARLEVISGTASDVLTKPTHVTSIIDTTTAIVTYPITLSSGATLAIGRSLPSGGASVKATTNGQPVSYYYSTLRYGILDGGGASVNTKGQTTDIHVIGPVNFKVGDYVIPAPSGLQLDPTYTISKSDVKVVKVDSVKSTITVNKDIYSDLVNISAFVTKPIYVHFSKTPVNEFNQTVSGVPIMEKTPYTFGIHFNAGGGTPKDTVAGIKWYDKKGFLLGSVERTALAPTTTGSPYLNANALTTWYPTWVTGVSPANAVAAVPYFSINAASSTNAYYVDAAMLCKPVAIKSYAVSTSGGNTFVTITTNEPHNFYPGNQVAVYEPSNTTINSDAVLIKEAAQDPVNKLYRFTYVLSGATASGATPTGYVSSFPMVVATTDGTNYKPLTVFEDAGEVDVVVKANRVNLCANPSFEKDLSGWSSTSGITMFRDDTSYVIGAYSLFVKFAVNSSNSGKYVQYNWVASNKSVPSRISVTPGKAYSASMYCYSGHGDQLFNIKISLDWYGNQNNYLSTSYSQEITVLYNEWFRATLEGAIAPAGAAYAVLKVYRSDTKTTSETWLSIDNVLIECSDTVGDYFDGSYDGFNFDPSRNSMWESAEHASPSHLYTDRIVNQNNIDSTLSEALYYG